MISILWDFQNWTHTLRFSLYQFALECKAMKVLREEMVFNNAFTQVFDGSQLA
jgi:hypothetical protein